MNTNRYLLKLAVLPQTPEEIFDHYIAGRLGCQISMLQMMYGPKVANVILEMIKM